MVKGAIRGQLKKLIEEHLNFLRLSSRQAEFLVSKLQESGHGEMVTDVYSHIIEMTEQNRQSGCAGNEKERIIGFVGKGD